ncbi:MAG: PAS domain S-box protein [Nannocystis sp.]|nr:histidine kinase [Nannocystis sp.]MBA3548728.1 PAS domain S-box protein [Nannocystis sp.]
MVRKGGSAFWSHWVTTPIRDEQEQLRGFAKVLHDNTERKAAEELREQLRKKERLLLQTQVRSTGEALDRTKEELRALAGSLLGAQEDERRRIARELHDDLSQRLAVLAIRLAALHDALPNNSSSAQNEALRLEKYVAGLAGEVRRLSHRLHPSILDDLGLAVALRRLVEDFQVSRDQPVGLTERDLPDDIAGDTAATLYRIAQEALRNISKHASTGPVRIELGDEGGELRLTIADSGPGFDHAAVRGRGGLGIISMQERARLVGGSLSLRSRPGEGTIIDVRVPLSPDDTDAGPDPAAPPASPATPDQG